VDLQLTDRVVVVTGGTDGLGRALAARLVEEGARVAVCGRDPDKAAAVAEALGPDRVLAVPADVTSTADLERFVAAVRDRWGRVDGLVNNAGVSSAGPFPEVSDEHWQADLDLKLHAAIRLTRMLVPDLRTAAAGAGTQAGGPAAAGAGAGAAVVNVLAIAARAPGRGSVPTSVSRAAGLALTKALAHDLGPDGIRANAVLIGFVDSGQWRRRAERRGVPVETVLGEIVDALAIPLGRAGRAEEFADLAAYLLSPRSSYVTGTAINLDGGASPVA
jgi:NAD(P)-dependent dehydrogenase (short-subunit alcohol dehydrogenase family)